MRKNAYQNRMKEKHTALKSSLYSVDSTKKQLANVYGKLQGSYVRKYSF